MNILAIETSCDETACAILKNGKLLSNIVVSQIDIFKAYGGVIPEVAARSHLEAILPVIDQAIKDAKVTWDGIDYIAVTHTPGLLGSLLIGTLTARTLAILHNKPLYAVHHLKSHIYSNWLSSDFRRGERCSFSESFLPKAEETYIPDVTEKAARNEQSFPDSQRMTSPEVFGKLRKEHSTASPKAEPSLPTFPLLALVISGGHTQIIYMKEHNDFKIIGTTLDDAVGECFDKVAKILGLPYPGGPSIAESAKTGNPEKYHFPHPKTPNSLDFSFSGLKTAVLRAVQKECGVGLDYPSHDLKNLLTPEQIADFSASFQKTAIDILLEKLQLAYKKYPNTKSIVFAGGVSANKALRLAASGETVSSRGLNPSPKTEETYIPDVTEKAVRLAFSADQWNDVSTGLRQTPKETVDRKRASESTRPQTLEAKQTKTKCEASAKIYFPEPSFSGDNAAMVAMACYWEIKSGIKPTDPYKLDISPRSELQ